MQPLQLKHHQTTDDISAEPMHWQNSIIDRLTECASSAGGWGYGPQTTPSAEPTALACLALFATKTQPSWVRAMEWLAGLQLPDGSWPITAEVSSPRWPTALALLAWLDPFTNTPLQARADVRKAVAWLLRSRGRRLPSNPTVHGHDTTLQGWAWVQGTHSWIEPTAYAIAALTAAGKSGHPRVREGVRLVLDRAITSGGWNYGNTRVFSNTLRPFPATTGIALAALAGEPRTPEIDQSIEYLADQLPRTRSPISLGWAVVGLTAWDARPSQTESCLASCAGLALQRKPNPLELALLLLADAKWYPSKSSTRKYTDVHEH